MIPPLDPEALVRATWEELGLRVTSSGPTPRVWVRTWEIPEKIGSIYLPDSLRTVYKGLPHSKLVRATVLLGNRGGIYRPGEFVCFPQTFFARYKYMVDGTLVGFVHPKYIHGKIELQEIDLRAIREAREGVPCAPT